MKRSAAVLLAVLALSLVGCAGTPDAAPSEAQDTATTSVEETAAPLVAETPSEQPAEEAEAQYLEYVRDTLLPETQIPDATDTQLIAAGHDVCSRIAAGESTDGMVVVEGEQPYENGYYYDSIAIIGGAVSFIC